MAHVFKVATGSSGRDGRIVINYQECTDDDGDNDDNNNDNKEKGGGNWDDDWGRATKTAMTSMPQPLLMSAFGI